MKKYNSIELLTGFLMGSFAGIMIELAAINLYYLFSRWRGTSFYAVDWWMFIPFPLISGIMMARAIASMHLEDY